MSIPYLDTVGNVNPAAADEVASLVYAMRTRGTIPAQATDAMVAAADGKVTADDVTGITVPTAS